MATDPNRDAIERAIEGGLERAFEQIERRIREEYLTLEAACLIIAEQWGEDVADCWDDWYSEYTEESS